MSNLVLLKGILKQEARAGIRSFKEGIQTVVEVLQPGPLKGRLGQWEAAKREEASAAVQRGLRNWSELQASLSKASNP